MKKIIFIIVVAFQFIIFTGASAATTQPVTVRVGVYDNNPKIYRDADGTIKGFWADITNYIAKKENWNLIYVYGTWEEGLDRLSRGEIDLMVDVAMIDERKALYDFNNETALLSWSVFYTRKGLEITALKDLEGKNIAIMESSVHYTGTLGIKNIFSTLNIQANIIDATSMDDVFKMLDTDQADAGVVNWHYGILNESKYKVNRTGLIFNFSELNYALPKDGAMNAYLIGVLDARLKELKNDRGSIYYKSVQNYFGESLGRVEVLPTWWNSFLIGLSLFILLVFVGLLLANRYQKTLKREIASGICEVKESSEKYSALINQAQDGIVIVQDGVIKFANKAIKIIGYTDVEVLNKSFVNLIAPEEQKKIIDKYTKRLAKGSGQAVYETKLAHKDGSIVDVEFSSGVIQYNDKPAIMVMVRDITGRKKTERAAAELNELRNKLIMTMSHQVRTPLTAMKWNLEVMLKKADEESLSPGHREMLQAIYDADVEMLRRTSDMLIVLDIEENRIFVRKDEVSLDSLLESVMLDIKRKGDIKDIQIDLEIDHKKTYVISGDAEKIRVAMEHLLNNAIDYTNNGGKVKVKLSRVQDKIRFEVIDNGIGIPTAEQALLFNRFFRGSNSFGMKPDANGLGLTITKFYIEKHDGQISFESTEGKGSKFWFDLPVIEQ